MLMQLLVGMLVMVSVVQQVRSEPATLIVPDDFSTIQEAIDYAAIGDTVYVRNGTYYENITVTKPINLIGENSAGTIINGTTSDVVVDVSADNVTIQHFTIATSPWIYNLCIYLKGCHHTSIINDEISSEGYSIRLVSSDENTLSGNVFGGGYRWDDITLFDSNDNVIVGNMQADLADVAVDLGASHRNLVVSNMFDMNFACAVIISGSHNNTFIDNTIVGFSSFSVSDSNGTRIYHNNINAGGWGDASVSNSFNTLWDHGYPSGGNYWERFDGPDEFCGKNQDSIGSDGIIDSPRPIPSDDRDNYPFKEPDGWLNHPISVETNVTITDKTVTAKATRFVASGKIGDLGYVNVTMPVGFNVTEIKVLIDDQPVQQPFPTITTNGTHYFVYFEFTLSIHQISIHYANAYDVNSDGVIDIFDIAAVALAFGSKPTDSNWNLDADINEDELIDIFDLVVVALHFGEAS